MKARMIGGIREADHRDPLGGLWLQAVAFPMTVTNYDALEQSDPEEITVHDEDELRKWADGAFDEVGYEIFDLGIPLEPGAPGCVTHHQPLLDLISEKKAAYSYSAPSTPEARGERDAVVAALDTVHTHARALLPGENPTTRP